VIPSNPQIKCAFAISRSRSSSSITSPNRGSANCTRRRRPRSTPASARENVVAAVPTASGKTFIAELALLTADGPGLYVCPLRALAREKYEAFAAPGVDAAISTGDFDASGEALAGNDVVVATREGRFRDPQRRVVGRRPRLRRRRRGPPPRR